MIGVFVMVGLDALANCHVVLMTEKRGKKFLQSLKPK